MAGGGQMPVNGGKLGDADLSAAIAAGAEALGQGLPADASDKLARLLEELRRWNARINLTAINDLEDMVTLHVLDSLAVRPHLRGPRIIDVGSGAGFPGLPLAIAEPQRRIELLESNARKIAFIRHIVGELDIGNAVPVNERVEHYAPAIRFDTVVARAFAALPRFIELAGHLLSDNGVLLALKGKYPDDELRQLANRKDLFHLWDYNVIGLSLPGLESHSRHIVRISRS